MSFGDLGMYLVARLPKEGCTLGKTSSQAARSPFKPLSTQMGALGAQMRPVDTETPGHMGSGLDGASLLNAGKLAVPSLQAGLPRSLLQSLEREPSSVEPDLGESSEGLLESACGRLSNCIFLRASFFADTFCSLSCSSISRQSGDTPTTDAWMVAL